MKEKTKVQNKEKAPTFSLTMLVMLALLNLNNEIKAAEIKFPETKKSAHSVSFNTIKLKDCPNEIVLHEWGRYADSNNTVLEEQLLIKGCKEDSTIKLNIERKERMSR